MVDKNMILFKNKELLLNKRDELMSGEFKYVSEDLKTIDTLVDRIEKLEGENLTDVVLIGSTFSVLTNFDGQEEVDTYTLSMDLDIELGMISALSRLGSAVFGSRVGETVKYFTDERDLEAQIVNEALDFIVDEKGYSYSKTPSTK